MHWVAYNPAMGSRHERGSDAERAQPSRAPSREHGEPTRVHAEAGGALEALGNRAVLSLLRSGRG